MFPARTYLVLASLLAMACQAPSGREYVRIGAMPPGTSWYVFAATLSNLLDDRLAENVRVEVIARGGGINNPILVERGRATIAIAQGATAAWAFQGTAEPYRNRRCPNIRAIAGGLNSVWMTAMLREDYIRDSGNDTLRKALTATPPARVVMKPEGSTVPVVADMLFACLGTSREQIAAGGGEIIQLSANQIPAVLRDGRADLYLETSIRGHPTVTEVTTTVDVRFVDFPDEVLDQLKGPGVRAVAMPEWFRGQDGPTKGVDMGTVLIANANMSDELAYLITKILVENRDEMARAHKAWADFDPAEGAKIENTGIPLHPGAARYYRERGLH